MSQSVSPPFLAVIAGDVDVYPTLEELEGHVEVYDLDGYEFFDADGYLLTARATNYRVQIERVSSDRQAERLTTALKSYFARLPSALASFSDEANRAQSLTELVELRQSLEESQRSSKGSRFRRPKNG